MDSRLDSVNEWDIDCEENPDHRHTPTGEDDERRYLVWLADEQLREERDAAEAAASDDDGSSDGDDDSPPPPGPCGGRGIVSLYEAPADALANLDCDEGQQRFRPAAAGRGPFRIPCDCGGSLECPECGGSGVDLAFTYRIEARLAIGWRPLTSVLARSAVDALRRARDRFPGVPADCLRPASLFSVEANRLIDRRRAA